MNVVVDRVGDLVELTIWSNDHAGLSSLITPAQWAALVDAGEELHPVQEYRRRRSLEAAREAASHATRGAA